MSETAVTSIKKSTGLFNLGLDSISAIKVTGLLKKRGLRIPVSKLVQEQTVKKLAVVAERTSHNEPSADKVQSPTTQCQPGLYSEILKQHNLVEEDVESILPTMAGQTYMLDMWAKSNGRLFYPSFWLAVEAVTKLAFDQAVLELAARIPMLRTTFAYAKTESGQNVMQICFLPNAARRYRLPWSYEVEEDEGKLLVTLKLHHALYDGVSLQLMISALKKICSGDAILQQRQLTTDSTFFSIVNEQVRHDYGYPAKGLLDLVPRIVISSPSKRKLRCPQDRAIQSTHLTAISSGKRART